MDRLPPILKIYCCSLTESTEYMSDMKVTQGMPQDQLKLRRNEGTAELPAGETCQAVGYPKRELAVVWVSRERLLRQMPLPAAIICH